MWIISCTNKDGFNSELIIVSGSLIWVEILNMPFSAGTTDFVRFWVIPNAAFLVWFAIDFRIFSARGPFQNVVFLPLCLLASFFFLFAAASLRALESCFSSLEPEATSSEKEQFASSHSPLSLSVILHNFYCLRIVFPPYVNFSWHLSILPFSVAFIALYIFSMMLLFASYFISFIFKFWKRETFDSFDCFVSCFVNEIFR